MQPTRRRLAQRRFARCGRIDRQALHMGHQGIGNQFRGGVLGLPNAQTDGAVVGVGGDARKKLLEPLKGIGL